MRSADDTLAAEERYLLQRIHEVRLGYEAAIKPYVDRLVYLHSIRPQPPIVITLEQAQAAGIAVPRAT